MIDLDAVEERWRAVEPGGPDRIGIDPDYLAEVLWLIHELREKRREPNEWKTAWDIVTEASVQQEKKVAVALEVAAEHRAFFEAKYCRCLACKMAEALS